MKKRFGGNVDLIHSPIIPALLAFTIPIMISAIFQQLYNTADTTIVGNYLGEKALASVGATAPIYELIVGFALGIGNGMGIVIARYFGAKQLDMVKKSVAHALIVGLIISTLVMLIGHFGLYPLLTLLNTPQDILNSSYAYIYTILIYVLVTFSYNLGAGLLRAVGNSLIPLLILIGTSLINIVLDIVFITKFNFGIIGAAYATVISQLISALTCFTYIYYKEKQLVPSRHDFKLDKLLLKELLSQGLSMGFMFSIVSIGTVILQTAVNQFGTLIIAAQTTARRVQFFFIIPITSLGSALTTFVSQNFGAQQYKRIKQAITYATRLSLIWGIFVAVLMHFFSVPLIQFVSGSSQPELVDNARLYIAIATPLFGILGILYCLRNALQGLGRKVEPLISSIIELVGKIVFVLIFVPQLGYLGIMLTEPIIWILMTSQLAYSFYTNPVIKNLQSYK